MEMMHPIIRYLIPCENVLPNPDNPRQINIVGLISAIRSDEAESYPLLYRELCVLALLTECRVAGEQRVEIQHADSGYCVFRSRPC